MLCGRGAAFGAGRIFVFHCFSEGLRAFPRAGEGLGCQGSSQPVPPPASSTRGTSWGWQGWQICPQQLLGILQCCQSWKALETAPKASPRMAVLGPSTGVGSQRHISAPSSLISKFHFYASPHLILNKTFMKPPDSLSWRFWETSEKEKTPVCQNSALGASQVPRPGAACGNERHIQRLIKVKAPLTARGLFSPPEDAPTAPPDVGLQGAGWGAAAGGGGEASQPDPNGSRLTDGAALHFTSGCR